MDDFEQAFLLQQQQLWLLLSLLDDRSAIMLFPVTKNEISTDQYKQMVFTLSRAGLLEYSAVGMKIIQPLRNILLGIKNAEHVYEGLWKKENGFGRQIFYSGSCNVLLQEGNGGQLRLWASSLTWEQWLADCTGLPALVLTDRQAKLLEQDPFVTKVLEESVQILQETSEVELIRQPDICMVMSHYLQDGSRLNRWIWKQTWQDTICISQSTSETIARLDCPLVRQRILYNRGK